MIGKFYQYYKNKRKYILLFILVIGLLVDLVPDKKPEVQDPPNSNIAIQSNYTTGSVVGVMTGSPGSSYIEVIWPLIEQPTKNFDVQGSTYYGVPINKIT